MKNVVFFALLVWLAACQSNTPEVTLTSEPGKANVTPEAVNTGAYQLEDVPGTDWQRAVKRDSSGKVLETGFFENGKKVGAWAKYEHNNDDFPSEVSNYKAGKINGLHMQFNEGGLVGLIAYYQNNVLHGRWGRYQFGRVVEEAEYKNGKLDGVYNIYTVATGKIQSSAEYKNGIQDGYYRTYHPDGNITVEYFYKNGEKVSGGAK